MGRINLSNPKRLFSCQQCKKDFLNLWNLNTKRKFCSSKCFGASKKGKLVYFRKRIYRISYKCQTCGFDFLEKHACKNRTPKFCSRKCAGARLIKWKTCKNCKKSFYNWQNVGFCSMKCSGIFKKGKPFPLSHIQALSRAKKGKFLDELSPVWKGDDVGYGALHDWVRKRIGHGKNCENCGKVGNFTGRVRPTWNIHNANKSGNYLRDISDWLQLCIRCHKLYDLEKLKIEK